MKKNFRSISSAIVFLLCFTQSYGKKVTKSYLYSEDDALAPSNVLVSEDTYVRDGSHANNNYGGASTLFVKSTSNNNFVREALMKFDLSAYSTITSAKLYFYGNAQVAMDLQVYGVNDDSWQENAVTWNNSPALGSNYGSVQMTTSYNWKNIDLTSQVQNEFSSGDKIFSIALKDDDFIKKTVRVYSKENSASFTPYLEIDGELVNTGETIDRDIYLVIGQSNTAGRGAIEAKDQVALSGVDLFNGSGWEAATNPMNAYSTIRKDLSVQGLSYAYTFGRTVNEVTGNQLGLVVNARGGTKIEQWTKGSSDGYYEAALAQLTLALQTPNTTLKGVLWHQGEGNRNDTNYLIKLENLIDDLRADLNIPDLLFIAGQLSQERTDNYNFNELLKQLPNTVTNSDYVSSSFLGTTDETHFDSNAQRILGGRYASKVLQMVYNYQLKTKKIWIDEDTYIRGGTNGNNSYGSETLVRVKELSSGTSNKNTRRGLLKFDLSSVSGNVIDANLFINASVSSGSEVIDMSFYETSSSWSENSVTMNNAPLFTNKIIENTISGSINTSREVFISEYVQDMSDTGDIISIGLQSDEAGSEQLKITTKEDTANFSVRPYLLITYIEDTATSSKNINQFDEILSPTSVVDKLIYTNPVDEELIVKNTVQIETVYVYDIRGKLLLTKKGAGLTTEMNVSELKSGTYVLSIIDNKGKVSKILIKK